MTIITVGADTESLLRQLGQRASYVERRIATEQSRENAGNGPNSFIATGALIELHSERDWLLNLILQITQGEL